MALLAEVLVEEWLNRQGFFTIRGLKLGVHEMDLLAIRPKGDGSIECRHVEVQASVNPISYMTRLTKADQVALKRSATSSGARTPEQIQRGVEEWVQKKFGRPTKTSMLRQLAPGPWSRELVIHRLKHPEELDMLIEAGIMIHRLSDILREMRQVKGKVSRASGSDFMDLLFFEDGSDSLDRAP